jgi:hypothetical protein
MGHPPLLCYPIPWPATILLQCGNFIVRTMNLQCERSRKSGQPFENTRGNYIAPQHSWSRINADQYRDRKAAVFSLASAKPSPKENADRRGKPGSARTSRVSIDRVN